MRNSVLEINDQQYLIKLDKSEFDLSFVHSLLKRIQTEKTFFGKVWEDDGDIISKRSIQDDDEGINHLSEK